MDVEPPAAAAPPAEPLAAPAQPPEAASPQPILPQGQAIAPDYPQPTNVDVLTAIHYQNQYLAQGFDVIRGDIAMILERLRDIASGFVPAQHAAPVQSAAPAPRVDANWDSVIFGGELATDLSISADRTDLVNGLFNGDPTATNLVGYLLVFRSSNAERMPVVLKDVGEAYYRWRPHSSTRNDAFRDALIHWLEATCAAAGVPNTIRIVTPGDRYDTTRHNAKEKGIDVADVFGWIVLRANGNVYTKANVSVK